MTIKRTRKCRLVGNLYDGWDGEFLDSGQQVMYMGVAEGRAFFAYVRGQDHNRVVEWRFSPKRTAAKMAEFGYGQDAIDVILNSDSPGAARTVASVDPEELRREGTVVAQVEVADMGGRWELRIDGEVVDERDHVEDNRDAKAWVEQVMESRKVAS